MATHEHEELAHKAMLKANIAKRQEIVAEMSHALREKLDWLLDWVKDDARLNILHRWNAGRTLRDVLDDAERNGCKIYGSGALKKLATISGEDESSLRMCIRIFEKFDQRKIEELADMVMADGHTPLNYSHFRQLVSVKDEHLDEFVQKTCVNHWTSVELGKAIMAKYGGSRSNNRKETADKPKDVSGIIEQQLSFARDFDQRNRVVWCDPENSLPAKLALLSTDDYTRETVDSLMLLSRKLREVSKEASDRANEAESKAKEMLDHLTGRLKDARILTEPSREKAVV